MALLALAVLLIAYEGLQLWRAKQRTQAVVAAAAQGELKLSDVPKRRIAMLLKVEDPNFYRHRGLDLSTPGAGLTSITQALVKRFYFDRFEPGFVKLEQSLIARFVLDPAMPKDRQLEAFLNFASFGRHDGKQVTGFADAARTFYGRDLTRISDREFLSLVGMLIAPNELNPIRDRRANAERTSRIEAMLAGKCEPTGLRDVTYEACARFAR